MAVAGGAGGECAHRRRDQLSAWDVRIRWAGRRPRLWRSVIADLELAQRMTERNTGLTLVHTRQTQEVLDGFTTSQPVRDALASADRARLERLRLDAERRAATYRAMSQAGAAACADLAHRYAALDQHVVTGVDVVAGLRGDLDQRDAEVRLLRGQLDADRALLGGALHE